MQEEALCDNSGICTPYPNETGDISNCIYCGKELVKIDGVWHTWDHDIHLSSKTQKTD